MEEEGLTGNHSTVRHHITSQQLLISLISLPKSNGSITTERQAEAEGVSVVILKKKKKIKRALRTDGSRAIPSWRQERFHTWQPLTDLKANLFIISMI